ncbi:hypothetical protein ANN_23685 [Periplaneta americana]|uniref:Uncharacterized protein n=1 Tax=Periplaneta americana TaxID=6978 RepID=A0ABQ8SMZ3_PERAM|nr:hypothetical protein ANN_23685 [Periplaneta americana]
MPCRLRNRNAVSYKSRDHNANNNGYILENATFSRSLQLVPHDVRPIVMKQFGRRCARTMATCDVIDPIMSPEGEALYTYNCNWCHSSPFRRSEHLKFERCRRSPSIEYNGRLDGSRNRFKIMSIEKFPSSPGFELKFEEIKALKNIVRSGNVEIGNLSFENVEKFKYLGATVTNINDSREEIKRKINMGNARYYSVEKFYHPVYSRKSLKLEFIKQLYYRLFYMVVKLELSL